MKNLFEQTHNPDYLMAEVEWALKGLAGVMRLGIHRPHDEESLSADEQYGLSCLLYLLADIAHQANDAYQTEKHTEQKTV